jgi:hypothetical protein
MLFLIIIKQILPDTKVKTFSVRFQGAQAVVLKIVPSNLITPTRKSGALAF